MNQELIEKARQFYVQTVEQELNLNFEKNMYFRFRQLESICNVLKNDFDIEKINFLETGTSQNFADACFGVFFGFLVRETNGKFYTVDIDGDRIEKSKKIFEKYLPDLNAKFYTEDSVNLCKNTPMTFNLVHLDSWDFDLKNPFPSALHGWKEFETLQNKIEDGGIVFVDDNFMGGSWIQWNWYNEIGEVVGYEKIDVDYPIIGKGAHVYDYPKYDKDWELIGDHYVRGENIKIIVKKNCKR